ncbi:TPA: hypothetical protein QFP15_002509, partial [Enterococcus faecium]
LPLGILNLIAPVYSLLPRKIKYTKVFENEEKRLKDISKLSANEIHVKEDQLLVNLIQYCYEHVPYYKELFDNYSINPNDIKHCEDLEKIPYLTKELLIKNRDKLISNEFSKDNLVYITTSGSTGTPTGFYVQQDSHFRDLAYVQYMFSELGYDISSSRLILRGKNFISQSKGKSWQWDAFKKELSVNIFDMSDENMEKYCCAIERYKPKFAYGYMSAMYSLCKYIKRRPGGLRHKFIAFIGISEMILDEQKQFVENIIGAPVKTFYGMSERVAIAKEEEGKYYIQPMYGIVELIDNKCNVIKNTNISGEIVGTSLLNYGMPLIRYRMGDMSSWAENDSKYGIGTEGRVLNKIEGRNKKDVLINCDKQIVSMASMEIHSDVYNYIERYQFVQSEVGKVIINVVLYKEYKNNEDILNNIETVFSKRTQNKIVFNAIEVEKIPLKKNGKLSIVIQNIDVDKL